MGAFPFIIEYTESEVSWILSIVIMVLIGKLSILNLQVYAWERWIQFWLEYVDNLNLNLWVLTYKEVLSVLY